MPATEALQRPERPDPPVSYPEGVPLSQRPPLRPAPPAEGDRENAQPDLDDMRRWRARCAGHGHQLRPAARGAVIIREDEARANREPSNRREDARAHNDPELRQAHVPGARRSESGNTTRCQPSIITPAHCGRIWRRGKSTAKPNLQNGESYELLYNNPTPRNCLMSEIIAVPAKSELTPWPKILMETELIFVSKDTGEPLKRVKFNSDIANGLALNKVRAEVCD